MNTTVENGAVIAKPNWLWSGGIALAVLSLFGCSQAEYGDLGLVSGKVTLDGKPCPNVQVVFSPTDGRPSMAVTNETGEYELVYIRTTKGAITGQHQVSIATIPPEIPPEEVARMRGPRFKDPIPVRYNSRSELTATVSPGPNSINFDLTKKS